MFSQRKSFFKRRGFYLLLAGILVFGYFINQGFTEKGPREITANTSQSDAAQASGETNKDNESTQISKEVPLDKTTGKGYFLVKETQGIVKVFHYDGQGNESLVKNTGVAFSLISEEDQKMFQKGIVVETDEELESLLENLES